MPALFPLGQISFTPGAMEVLSKPGAKFTVLLARHAMGDWGDLDDFDKAANADALANGDRILSSYRVKEEKVWIITEADRKHTVMLLPEEY